MGAVRTPVIRMEGITKRFPGVLALSRVRLDLYAGEVLVLLGENGAGKSTLMKILSGALSADSGEIFLEGVPLRLHSPRHAQEKGISTIYQEFNLVPQLSAAENIFLGKEPTRIPGIVDRKVLLARSRELLTHLGTDLDPTRPVRALSVAEQQMVEVAKALVLEAKVLIMDEPTSALTHSEIENLFNTIRSLKSRGVAVVYISHRLEEIFEIGDRVTVMRDGEIVDSRALAEVSVTGLVRMMANRELKEHYPRAVVPRGDELFRVEELQKAGTFHDISFGLNRGEILGFAGLVGCGRTALAETLFGVASIDSGRLYWKGREVRIESPGKAIQLGIGFLTEDRKQQGLLLNLPVKRNIALTVAERLSRFGFISESAENHLARNFVRSLSIRTPSLGQKVAYLSGGNQQKVVLSKWLARECELLIFDEPTRGIDVAAKVEIYELMNELTRAGNGIIMISSDLPEIMGMSDRILVMREGRIAAEFFRGEATQESVLTAALGHQEEHATVRNS